MTSEEIITGGFSGEDLFFLYLVGTTMLCGSDIHAELVAGTRRD